MEIGSEEGKKAGMMKEGMLWEASNPSQQRLLLSRGVQMQGSARSVSTSRGTHPWLVSRPRYCILGVSYISSWPRFSLGRSLPKALSWASSLSHGRLGSPSPGLGFLPHTRASQDQERWSMGGQRHTAPGMFGCVWGAGRGSEAMSPEAACILHSLYVHRRMTGPLRPREEQNSSHAESPLKRKAECSEIYNLTW